MKISFNDAVLARISQELQLLVGGKIQRISQPQPLQIVFSIFKSDVGEKHLLIDVSPRFYRVHLTSTRAPNAPTPPAFCAILRKYLDGARITKITQRDGDRILDLHFAVSNSKGNDSETYLLTCELMGKHANAILVSPQNKILHAAKLINSKVSRVREILPGKEYSAPPAPQVAREVSPAREISSAVLDEYYANLTANSEFEDLKNSLGGVLSKTLKKKNHALEQVRKGTHESTLGDQYRRWGELIFGNLQQVKTGLQRGVTSVEVLNFYDENQAQTEIPIDADLSATENAERYFARARHVEENAQALKARESTLAREAEELAKFLASLESAQEINTLRELQKIAVKNGWLRAINNSESDKRSTPGSAQTASFDGFKIKRLISPDGFTILVGENATANDYLVTRLSQSNDWWLHLRGGTSSHAIIQTHNAPDRVPRSTLEFAARAVASRSIAKHAGWAEVDYTLRKYVRKPRKAAPGSVVHTNAKTLHVESDSKK